MDAIERKYQDSMARLRARYTAGDLDSVQFADRVARVTATRDERRADQRRAESRAAARRWNAMTPDEKARARLAIATRLRGGRTTPQI